MQNFKIQDKQLQDAVLNLKEANRELAANKKTADNAKETIKARLKVLRDCDVETLSIGDMVSIENLLLIEIGKQNKFDLAAFQVKHPELYASFMRDFATTKYKALI